MAEGTAEVRLFQRVTERVPDPSRPGRTLVVVRWVPQPTRSLTAAGQTWAPNSVGWFELPTSLVASMTSASAQWKTRASAVALGIDNLDDEEQPKPTRRAKS